MRPDERVGTWVTLGRLGRLCQSVVTLSENSQGGVPHQGLQGNSQPKGP